MFLCILGKCKSPILHNKDTFNFEIFSLSSQTHLFIYYILYVLEVTRKLTNEVQKTIEFSTNEIKEENMKVAKENVNHLRGDITYVMEQLSLLNKKFDKSTQPEERSTQNQKSNPVDFGETTLG